MHTIGGLSALALFLYGGWGCGGGNRADTEDGGLPPPDSATDPEDAATENDAGPGEELCGDDADNDGDGEIDEGCDGCTLGETRDCHEGDPTLAGTGACRAGTETCEGGEFPEWGACVGAVGPVAEICDNGIDDDCDGATDEDCPCTGPECGGCTGDECDCVVGRAVERGAGKVFVWGDEHVTFEEYWPDSAPFWANTIDWLSTDAAGTRVRTTVYSTRTLPAGVTSLLSARGMTLSTSPSAQIWIGVPEWDAPPGAAFVEAGGAVMLLAVGWGSGMSECTRANARFSELGLAYNCSDPPPWGPVSSYEPHPIADGLVSMNAPFVNGRYVMDVPGGTSSVVAHVDCDPSTICVPGVEVCDGVDNDCNGVADEISGCPCSGPECSCGGAGLERAPAVTTIHDCSSGFTTFAAAESCATELHVVGVYEPSRASSEIRVHVSRPGAVVLVLSAYSTTHWIVTADSGSTIAQVMLNGYEASTASAPAGVPVVDHSAAGYLTACAISWPIDDGGCDTPGLVAAVERETGLPLTGFHGCYDLGEITIGD